MRAVSISLTPVPASHLACVPRRMRTASSVSLTGFGGLARARTSSSCCFLMAAYTRHTSPTRHRPRCCSRLPHEGGGAIVLSEDSHLTDCCAARSAGSASARSLCASSRRAAMTAFCLSSSTPTASASKRRRSASFWSDTCTITTTHNAQHNPQLRWRPQGRPRRCLHWRHACVSDHLL